MWHPTNYFRQFLKKIYKSQLNTYVRNILFSTLIWKKSWLWLASDTTYVPHTSIYLRWNTLTSKTGQQNKKRDTTQLFCHSYPDLSGTDFLPKSVNPSLILWTVSWVDEALKIQTWFKTGLPISLNMMISACISHETLPISFEVYHYPPGYM